VSGANLSTNGALSTNDNLSTMHLKAVRAEIEGRFFSAEEASQLKQAIDLRTVTDPRIREAAAKCWEPR
jgi:hypothetical protein